MVVLGRYDLFHHQIRYAMHKQMRGGSLTASIEVKMGDEIERDRYTSV